MADYYPLLSRAVAALPPNAKEARTALYDRARVFLQDQLRAANPPVPEAQIDVEAAALESAIKKIEFEVWRSAARVAREAPSQPIPPGALFGPTDEAQTAPQSEQSMFSPMLLGVLGIIALVTVAVSSYRYVSRPNANPAIAAARMEPKNASRTDARRQEAGKKVAVQHGKRAQTTDPDLPYILRRQLVFYRSTYPPGTIIIAKSQHTLYQIRAATVALQYSIGIGPNCVDSAGLHRVMRKEMWPEWPPSPAGSETKLTAAATAGAHRPESRLGARAIYLSDLEYGIHGTDKPQTIGQNTSFGCFLLIDDDVSDLYDRAAVDTRVVIMN